MDDTTPIEKQTCSVHTVVRPLAAFPAGFENLARGKSPKITPVRAERVVLNNLIGKENFLLSDIGLTKFPFTATIHRFDPDVIIGHEFSGVTLDVLLHRLRELKADHWSRLGRFRREKWPRLRNGLNSHLLNGRLVLDLGSEGSKVWPEGCTIPGIDF